MPGQRQHRTTAVPVTVSVKTRRYRPRCPVHAPYLPSACGRGSGVRAMERVRVGAPRVRRQPGRGEANLVPAGQRASCLGAGTCGQTAWRRHRQAPQAPGAGAEQALIRGRAGIRELSHPPAGGAGGAPSDPLKAGPVRMGPLLCEGRPGGHSHRDKGGPRERALGIRGFRRRRRRTDHHSRTGHHPRPPGRGQPRPRHAYATVLGISADVMCWGTAAAVGASAVLAASPTACTALSTAGALYLSWLGVGMLRRARHRGQQGQARSGASPDDAERGKEDSPLRS